MTATSEDPAARGVIVTGGGTGIGRATARAFARQGAQVLIVGRTESTLIETAKEHPGIRVLAADITDPEVPRLVVDTAVREFGRLDVLVNNAAVLGYRPLPHIDRDLADRQLGTNLVAPIFLTQRALDPLEATGGTVVNLSTAGSLGLRSWPNNSLYGAAKVALDFLTRTWAVELGPRGIRVVGIAPGVIDTASGPQMGMTPEQYAGFLQQISTQAPAGRVGTPEEVAWWIVQLTSPEAAYANGMVLPVDGALSLT
ncbi:ketoreductase [Actinomadura craniellae]|uniref:Ketoreductase n=1 Tax=Actinomadura craniellae TaxID=2231787 RepID=A0A365H0X1_9ACTN|nr:SDR family oxidoreductase [Actinomadura craniellae]RAY12699.1 ketoreductase [Actinomadura craniellae]